MGTSNHKKTDDLSVKLRELEEQNRRLRSAVDELSTLNELSLAISGSVDSEEIMRTIIGKSIRSVDAEQGDITLVDGDADKSGKTLVRSMVSSREHAPLHLNQNLLGWMQINKKPLMVNDPGNDARFRNVDWDESIKSILSAPLMTRSRLIGILTVYNKKEEEGFTEEDQRLLSIIASQSAQVVENARLHEEEQALREMQREMELASKIQRQLLPKEPPAIDGYGLFGKNVTAHKVGGDYFDFIQLDDDRWAICLGDVSGKGLPASLLMSNLQAILRGQVVYKPSPGALLRDANRQLFRSTNTEKFVTLFLGILDTGSHTLTYSIGGHEFPYVIHKDDSFDRLQTGGVPVGIMDGQEYEEQTVELLPGDTLVVYSDGITDIRNGEDEVFGEKRLERLLLERTRDEGAERLLTHLFDECLEHSGEEQIFDDMTAVVLSREP